VSEAPPPPLAVSQEKIRIEFHRTGDRFSHTILGLHNGQAEPLLESIEGGPEDRFPPSPPLAELHKQGETIFLTGATHAGHWSMSIEPVQLDSGAGFLFDAACRVKSLPEGLTSSYQVAKSVKASQDNASLILSTAWGSFRLESLPLPDAEEQPSCQLAFTENKAQLIGHVKGANTLPTTVRWRYQLINIAAT